MTIRVTPEMLIWEPEKFVKAMNDALASARSEALAEMREKMACGHALANQVERPPDHDGGTGYFECSICAADAERKGKLEAMAENARLKARLSEMEDPEACREAEREIERLRADLAAAQAEGAAMREVLLANLRDFRRINDSSLWHGHPFTHAVRDIASVLAGTTGHDLLDRMKVLEEALRDLISLARQAMHQANSDGAEYDVEGELTEAKATLKENPAAGDSQ